MRAALKSGKVSKDRTQLALMALPLTVPVLNLAVPVVGAAAFTHLFHRLAQR